MRFISGYLGWMLLSVNCNIQLCNMDTTAKHLWWSSYVKQVLSGRDTGTNLLLLLLHLHDVLARELSGDFSVQMDASTPGNKHTRSSTVKTQKLQVAHQWLLVLTEKVANADYIPEPVPDLLARVEPALHPSVTGPSLQSLGPVL